MRSRCAKYILLLTLGLACISTSIAQSEDPIEELKACAKMTDRDARFACYDNLGERVVREESAAKKSPTEMVAQPEGAATTGTATNAPSLPDDLRGEVLEDRSQSTIIQQRGLITSCNEGRDGKWYFYFDNGQVWKQVNALKLHYKECNFTATITRDGFGYKMQIDSKKRKIRVSRKR